MNGIKMKDCRFYVNEEARTVVCVIPKTRDMVLNFMGDHFRWSDLDMWGASQFSMDHRLRMPYSFSGKAVCAPEDTWDEELGRKIAFSKAKDKCYKSFFKRANLYVQTVDRRLNDMIEQFNNFGAKLEAKRELLHTEIDNKLKPEE